MTSARVISLCFAGTFVACIQPLETPWVGDCAGYPEGLYDYGDLEIGTCLSGPVGLSVLPGEGNNYRLLVVNANPNLLFRSGSVLEISGAALESAIDAGETSVLVQDVAADNLVIRSFSGPLSVDQERQVAFYGNRLSFTTADGANDRVEGVWLDGGLSPFTGFDTSTGPEDTTGYDHSYGVVGWDPFAVAVNPDDDRLYVVNITSHDITEFDTSDLAAVSYADLSRPVRLPEVEFVDTGAPSLLELANFVIDPTTLVGDSWKVSFLESPQRLLYGMSWQGRPALGQMDSPDGLSWYPNTSNPVLTGGVEGAWDQDGVKAPHVNLDTEGVTYLLWYEGIKDGLSQIGFASTSTSWPGAYDKYDAGEEDTAADDAVITAGPDAYDLEGASAPTVLMLGDNFRIWYTATGDDGVSRIATASATDAIEWTKEGVVWEGEGDDVVDPYILYPFYHYRLYFIEGDVETSTCLKLATSDNGQDFEAGDGGVGTSCLLTGGEGGLGPILRQPALYWDGALYEMWIESADTSAGPWKIHHARSYDGIRWKLVGEAALAEGASQLSWAEGLPGITVVAGTELYGSVRLEGEDLGNITTGIPVGASLTYGGLSFTTFEGHAVPLPGPAIPWWGTGEAAPPVAGDPEIQLEDPMPLPGGESLLMTARREGVARIGTAMPLSGDLIPPGSAWSLTAEGASLAVDADLLGVSDIADPFVVESDEGIWWMYLTLTLQDGLRVIGRLESGDLGDSWSQSVEVLRPAGDEAEVYAPTVVRGHDGNWHLWYAATVGSLAEVRHATSSDGQVFTRQASGGIGRGDPGSWDDAALTDPTVLWDEDNQIYHLWYSGSDGARIRIGYALGTVGDNGDISWEKYRSSTSGLTLPVVNPSALSWDANRVQDPVVTRDGDLFRMWLEGSYDGTLSRVGYAESWDGIFWVRVYLPGSAGDYFTFETGTAREDDEELTARENSTVQYDLDSFGTYAGWGGTVFALTPPNEAGVQCFGVLTMRYRSAVYVFDVHDDSAALYGGRPGPCVTVDPDQEPDPDFVDSNYGRIESIYLLKNNLSTRGSRQIAFSGDGTRMYLTSSFPTALLVVDITSFEDNLVIESTDLLDVVGYTALPRAEIRSATSNSDDIADDVVTSSIGPTGLLLSPDGRYAYVANGNDASVYIIDLTGGYYGEVVAVAEVGEVPYSLALSPDGRRLFVGDYVGEVDGFVVNSTLTVVDVDVASTHFGQVLTTVRNREL